MPSASVYKSIDALSVDYFNLGPIPPGASVDELAVQYGSTGSGTIRIAPVWTNQRRGDSAAHATGHALIRAPEATVNGQNAAVNTFSANAPAEWHFTVSERMDPWQQYLLIGVENRHASLALNVTCSLFWSIAAKKAKGPVLAGGED